MTAFAKAMVRCHAPQHRQVHWQDRGHPSRLSNRAVAVPTRPRKAIKSREATMSKRTQNPAKSGSPKAVQAAPQEYRKPRADVYTVLLVVALVMLIVATVVLWMIDEGRLQLRDQGRPESRLASAGDGTRSRRNRLASFTLDGRSQVPNLTSSASSPKAQDRVDH